MLHRPQCRSLRHAQLDEAVADAKIEVLDIFITNPDVVSVHRAALFAQEARTPLHFSLRARIARILMATFRMAVSSSLSN